MYSWTEKIEKKRYILFDFCAYDGSGGLDHINCSFDNLKEVNKLDLKNADYIQIFDVETFTSGEGKTIDEAWQDLKSK